MGADAAKAIEGLLASVNKPAKGVVGTVDRRRPPADRRDHRVRRAAGRARPHLARAGARAAAGSWALLRARLLSFGMILGLAFLLMVSLVLGAAISALGKWWGPAASAAGRRSRRSSTSLVGFGLTTACSR